MVGASSPGVRYHPQDGAFYTQRCACGQMVDVPASGQLIDCQACGQSHVWPTSPIPEAKRFTPSPDGRRRVIKIVSLKNPQI